MSKSQTLSASFWPTEVNAILRNILFVVHDLNKLELTAYQKANDKIQILQAICSRGNGLTHHSYLFSFLLYYPFFEKDMPLHLNKIENPLPMNALCVKIFIPSKKTWSFIFQTCFLFSKNWFLESSAALSFCIILNDTILCLWSLSYCNVGKTMHTLWIFFFIKSYTALQLKKIL